MIGGALASGVAARATVNLSLAVLRVHGGERESSRVEIRSLFIFISLCQFCHKPAHSKPD